MKKLLLTSVLVIGLYVPQQVLAADTYTIDASHTNILLKASHAGFSNMVIEALKPEGQIIFDAENPENSSVSIKLKAAHIDGDDEKFNTHLQSADFFNVEKFPVITFKSTKVEVTGEDKGVVTGNLNLLGISKPVSLNVTFNKAGKNPFNQKETIGFSAIGALKRSDFGMNYGLPLVGDEVTVDINLEAAKEKENR